MLLVVLFLLLYLAATGVLRLWLRWGLLWLLSAGYMAYIVARLVWA